MLIESVKNKNIVIVGATGAGKTALAISLAKKSGGEIISADSRAVYKGMDIGTAKPSLEERAGILHYGFDLVRPDEKFNAYDFQQYALHKISEIRKREKTPIIVGGTGLYVDALIYEYDFSEESKKNYTNRRAMSDDYVVIGLNPERSVLRARLKQRIDAMFQQGIIEETKRLLEVYSVELAAFKANLYAVVIDYLAGKIDLETAKTQAFYRDWSLVRRQLTWFRRNPNIIWLETPGQALDYLLGPDK